MKSPAEFRRLEIDIREPERMRHRIENAFPPDAQVW